MSATSMIDARAPRSGKPTQPALHLPEAEWPRDDRERFASAFEHAHDIFEDAQNGAHLKPRTRSAIRYCYRRWLAWLAAVHPDLLEVPPHGRVTPGTIKAFVTHLRGTCNPRTVASQLGKLYSALRYMYPGQDWRWLADMKARLERAVPKPARKPVTITSQRLIDASLLRLDQVDADHASGLQDATHKYLQALALRYRDALLVAVVAFLTLRRTNLADLTLGSTLWRGPAGWTVQIPGDRVKNLEPIRAEFPAWIGDRIDRYLEIYRPLIFRSGTHKGFWASAKGQPATGDALYHAFQKEVKASLDLRLTLHDTRRIGATTWAIHDPVNAAGAKDLLGDRSDRVFAQHYNLASGIEASRAMASLIAGLRPRKR